MTRNTTKRNGTMAELSGKQNDVWQLWHGEGHERRVVSLGLGGNLRENGQSALSQARDQAACLAEVW